MKLNLDCIIIFVRNADRLKSFYADILKPELLEESKPGWLLLKAGHCKIGLHKIGDSCPDNTNGEFNPDNNTKIVFEVDEDIHIIRERLLKENVPLKEVKTFEKYGYWVCDGEDPEGNVFQLKQKKK